MQGLQLTEPVRNLLEEAEALRPGHPIIFETMNDTTLLQRSAGAATVTDASGRESIYLDPDRTDAYKIAHEIRHLILHRSGHPQMFYMLPDLGFEPLERRVADEIDNILDHYTFNPRLDSLGLDPKPYKEWFVSVFDTWPTQKIQGPDVLINAFKVLDGLLLGIPYRDQIVSTVKRRQPQILTLAQRIEERIVRSKETNEVSVRSAMVDILDFLSRWITKQIGHQQSLRKVIGISPLLTDKNVQKLASEVINLISQPYRMNGRSLWLVALELKSDNTRFHTHCFTDKLAEPAEVMTIRQQWQTEDLRTFLSLQGVGLAKPSQL